MWETVKKQSSSSFSFSNSDLVDLTLWTVQFESTMLKGPHFSQLKRCKEKIRGTSQPQSWSTKFRNQNPDLHWLEKNLLRRMHIKEDHHNAINRPCNLIVGPNRSFIVKAMIKDGDTHSHPQSPLDHPVKRKTYQTWTWII